MTLVLYWARNRVLHPGDWLLREVILTPSKELINKIFKGSLIGGSTFDQFQDLNLAPEYINFF
jgi:hypothetical protein